MTCTVCGSTTPCTCTVTGEKSCCAPGAAVSPKPYYTFAGASPEAHNKNICIYKYAYSLCPDSSWNVPGCGEITDLSVPGLDSITLGAFIWNAQFGYFRIVAFNKSKECITIINDCTSGNAAAGTNVAACTCFILTDTPQDINISDQCVAVSFTAPEVDACIDITLTNTEGLTASDTIQIGSGFYSVQAVKPNDIITICNTGEGIAPGTPVIATDANGEFLYCINVISTSPCDRAPTLTGALIACNPDGITVPLAGLGAGYIPVLINPAVDQAAEYRPPPAPMPYCTRLSAPFLIVSGNAGPYTIDVDDSSGFAINDITQLDNRTDRFIITGIPNATQVTGTLDPVPGANGTVAADDFICVTGCCEQIQNKIDALTLTPIFDVDAGGLVLDSATPNGSSLTKTENITNPSTQDDMAIAIILDGEIHGDFTGKNVATGTFTANGATAVAVADTAITADSSVIFALKTVGGTPAGAPFLSAVTPGTGFSVKVAAGDTSIYNYQIITPIDVDLFFEVQIDLDGAGFIPIAGQIQKSIFTNSNNAYAFDQILTGAIKLAATIPPGTTSVLSYKTLVVFSGAAGPSFSISSFVWNGVVIGIPA